MTTSITIAQALAYEQDPSQIPPNTTFDIVDIAANIETLNDTEISSLSSLLHVTSMTATDAPVTFTPGGPEQAALASTGTSITSYISASEAIALDVVQNMSGTPLLVPPDESVIVVDTAANLEGLTPNQLSDLGSAVDTVNASGGDTGKSAVTSVAATDAPPVFSADQVVALSTAGITIVAPPNDPGQNAGETQITGRGMTFDLIWDPSVASAPAEFKTDVEEVAQMYADTYSSPATIYVHVGYGEVDGSPLDPGDLGENIYFHAPKESYQTLVSRLTADATSPAQLQALSTLPATNPTDGGTFFVPGAEARTLGFANAPTSSVSDPDGYMGFDSDTAWNFSPDPNQTPVAGEYDFIGSVEHELSEILGRTSFIGDSSTEKFTNQYSVMDLYRYQGANDPALRPRDDPSYFSIDNGVTDLADYNNYKTGNSGDLGDWSGTTVNGVVRHTPDSFNDNSNPGIINPFTATDATLMNVLGYNFTDAPTSPIPLNSSDITLSTGQLLMDLTLDEMNPGSVDAPAGSSYVVIDTAFDIESLTPAAIRDALSIGVSEFIVDGAIAFLQGSNDPKDNQIAALGSTPFIAALTAAEAVAAEDAAAGPNPPSIPANETVIVADTAANIEGLNPNQIIALASIDVSQIDVFDLSGTGPLIIQNGDTYLVDGAVTADEKIHFATTGGILEFDDTSDMKGTITGFKHGDKIVLTDVPHDKHGNVNLLPGNVLEVTEDGATYDLQLNPNQHDFAGEFFHLHADPNGGTEIVENRTPCYCRGTLIETGHGEKPVESLAIGDLVMTKAGTTRPIKWIGRRSFSGRFIAGRKDILPICIKAGALDGNVPRRDLWISPLHAMYFASSPLAADGVLIEARNLVNGASIVQAGHVDAVEYFHIELDTHDVLVAEGTLSESFVDDDSRAMFHNVHEFRALYPGAAVSAARYCAPRLEAGYELEAVRKAIARRAGLSPRTEAHGAGRLRGYVDVIGRHAIEGWAQNIDAPEAPVCLDIFVGGRYIGEVLANRFRDDLAAAGLGSGHHAFTFELPAELTIGAAAVEVRRSLDGRGLEISDSASTQRQRRL